MLPVAKRRHRRSVGMHRKPSLHVGNVLRVFYILPLQVMTWQTAGQNITTPPNNTVKFTEGPAAALLCGSSADPSSVTWIRSNDSVQLTLNDKCKVKAKYDTMYYVMPHPYSKQCNLYVLIIHAVGRYQCKVGATTADAGITFLVGNKLHGQQSARTAVEGDEVQFACWIQYRGPLVPQLDWSPSATVTNHSHADIVNTSATVTAKVVMPVYTCTLHFPPTTIFPHRKWVSLPIHVSPAASGCARFITDSVALSTFLTTKILLFVCDD